MRPLSKWHRVTDPDSKRIQCDVDGRTCSKPAFACQHNEWDTGNTTGISFWYYCREHAKEQYDAAGKEFFG